MAAWEVQNPRLEQIARTRSTVTRSALALTRPLASFRLCVACEGELERARSISGHTRLSARFCPHQSVFAHFAVGCLTIQPCRSDEEAADLLRLIGIAVQQLLAGAQK